MEEEETPDRLIKMISLNFIIQPAILFHCRMEHSYAAATGTGIWQVTALSGIIYPGSYYLVQEAAGTGGVFKFA